MAVVAVPPAAVFALGASLAFVTSCFVSAAGANALGCLDEPRSSSWTCKAIALGVLGQCTSATVAGYACGAFLMKPEIAAEVAKMVASAQKAIAS